LVNDPPLFIPPSLPDTTVTNGTRGLVINWGGGGGGRGVQLEGS